MDYNLINVAFVKKILIQVIIFLYHILEVFVIHVIKNMEYIYQELDLMLLDF